jgi:hypothetical protein
MNRWDPSFLLLVENHPAAGIHAAPLEEILHGAVKLIPMAEIKIEHLLSGILSISALDHHRLQWNHPLSSA